MGNSLIPPLPEDHPLRAAKWIWPEGTYYLHNHYAHFRHVVELDAVPESAPFYITADQCYRLWVNGKYICRGPARGYQSHWPFDEVDLAPYLKQGKNLIAVVGYQAGCSTFGYLHNHQAGFIAAGKWGDVEIATNEENWLMRRSPGHETNTVRYSMQIAYQEFADLRKLDSDWLSRIDWEDDFVGPEKDRPSPGFRNLSCHNACWQRLEERGIPMLREERKVPAAVIGELASACAAGWENIDNASWLWVGEAEKLADKWQAPSCDWKADSDWLQLEVPAIGAGSFRAYTIDLGEYRVANDIIRISGAAGGEVIDLQHDEQIDGLHAKHVKRGGSCAVAMANRVIAGNGENEHEFFHHLGHRYLTLIVRGSEQTLRIFLAQRSVGYPFSMRGRFECNDETLNFIEDACRVTQQICSLDAYVDTPWREQAQWWGDARVQFANTIHLDGDSRLLARGVRSIAGQPGPEGLTYGHAPTMAFNCVLPDFSCTWLLTLSDHWWQTGSTELIKELWWRAEEVLAYFDQLQVRHKTGLIAYDTRFWYFGDWSTICKPAAGAPTFLNCWYCYALEQLVPCLEAAGMAEEANRLSCIASEHRKLIEKHLLKDGLLIGGLDKDGNVVDQPSQHDQVMALMLSLKGIDEKRIEDEILLPWLKGDAPERLAEVSPFWCYYLLDEMAKRGYGNDVVNAIRERWKPMCSTGTTWEHWTPCATVSHAWTSHPSAHLPAVLAGIRQTAAGWKEARVSPCFADGIDRVDCLVPTPAGDLSVNWNRTGGGVSLSITVPQGMKASLNLPGQCEETLQEGTFERGC